MSSDAAATASATCHWKTTFGNINRCLSVEPPGLEFSCCELKSYSRRGLDRLASIASNSLSRPGRHALTPALVKIAAESAHGLDEFVALGRPDDEAILVLLWGTKARCASLLHLHALALRAFSDPHAMATMDAKERNHYAILQQSLSSLLASILETPSCREGSSACRLRSVAFTVAAMAVRMDTLTLCSRLLALVREDDARHFSAVDLAALARLPAAFLCIARCMLRSTVTGSAVEQRVAGTTLEAVMEALVRCGAVEHSASALVRASLAAKARYAEFLSGCAASRTGQAPEGRPAAGPVSTGKDGGRPGKRGSGGGAPGRRDRGATAAAAAAAAAAPAAKAKPGDDINIAGFVAALLTSVCGPLKELLDACNSQAEATSDGDDDDGDDDDDDDDPASSSSTALWQRVAEYARAILSGPCMQYAMAAHVLAQLTLADGGPLYGLSEANMLPPCLADAREPNRALSAGAAAQQGTVLWTGMLAAVRMWHSCMKALPPMRFSPCGRGAMHALSVRMVRVAMQLGGVGSIAGARLPREGVLQHPGEQQQQRPTSLIHRMAVLNFGLDALRFAEATCAAPPVLFRRAPRRGDGNDDGLLERPDVVSAAAVAEVAEWWLVAVPLCHALLSHKMLMPESFMDIFALDTICWPAGDLPPSPPLNLAAALRAGYLPLLEKTLRAQQLIRDNAAKATLLLCTLCDWHVTGRLLAYGIPTEAAALVVTAGKLLRRLFSVGPGPNSDWVERVGGDSSEPVARRISNQLMLPMHAWLRTFSRVLLCRQDVAAEWREGVLSTSDLTLIHSLTALTIDIEQKCYCKACRGRPCFEPFSAVFADRSSSSSGAVAGLTAGCGEGGEREDDGDEGDGAGDGVAVGDGDGDDLCTGCGERRGGAALSGGGGAGAAAAAAEPSSPGVCCSPPGSGVDLHSLRTSVDGSSTNNSAGSSSGSSNVRSNGNYERGHEDAGGIDEPNGTASGKGCCANSAGDPHDAVSEAHSPSSGPYLMWHGAPSARLLQLIPLALRHWLPPMASFACAKTAAREAGIAGFAQPRQPPHGGVDPNRDHNAVLLLSSQLRVADVVLTWIPALVSAHAIASDGEEAPPFQPSTIAFTAGSAAAARTQHDSSGMACVATRLRHLLLHELDAVRLVGMTLTRIATARVGFSSTARAAVARLGRSDASDLLNRAYVALELLAAEFPEQVTAALHDDTLTRVPVGDSQRTGVLFPRPFVAEVTATTGDDTGRIRAAVIERLLQLQELEPAEAATWRVPLSCATCWLPEMCLADMGTLLVRGSLTLEPPARTPPQSHTRCAAAAAAAAAAAEPAEPLLRTCGNPRCANLEGDSEATLRLRGCSGCGHVSYCGLECQREHWREGHREECGGRKQEGGGAAGPGQSTGGAGDRRAPAAEHVVIAGRQWLQRQQEEHPGGEDNGRRRRACDLWWA